jgi:hypothetical protein
VFDEKHIKNEKRFGATDLSVAGFQLWVHGRQYESSQDYWDGNWLNVLACCSAKGASVQASGAILTAFDIDGFGHSLRKLYDGSASEASLSPVEPELSIRIRSRDRLGHREMIVKITPDNINQNHKFTFELDQSFLLPIITQCEAIIQKFPIRGNEPGHGAQPKRR